MKKINLFFIGLCSLAVSACDLQPKIVALPDTVGEFISARYPALLADPNTQPEIYNSAAIDYGVYASPNLYGSVERSDYVEYASVNDYIVPPQYEDSMAVSMYGTASESSVSVDYGAPISDDNVVVVASTHEDYLTVPMYGGMTTVQTDTEIVVAAGDTLYSLAKKYNTTSDEIAKLNNLSEPYALSVGQKLKVPTKVETNTVQTVSLPAAQVPVKQTTTRVELDEITVGAGDTLYSISRKYSVPVNDLAVMNNLSAPFVLSIGQKLKVPDLSKAPVRTATAATTNTVYGTTPVSSPVTEKTQTTSKSTTATTTKTKEKISSDPTKKLPAISARSSSKFSWPVRGKILSNYGAKSGGLFNDGINIGASKGTAVKAAENGVVAYAGNEVKGMGNLIIIQHSGGWMTVYAHMDSMVVRRGTKVSVGQKIGTVGATGKVDEPQLHFEIRKGTKAYNPSSYLKK